ncbi:MAG: HigA family addiction module antitoxin [Candidatus Sulfotelmatobacter sp.]
MSIKNENSQRWAVHPGEILREEFLEPMGISSYRLDVELHVSPPTVNDIIREKRGITPEMAARLAKYFGNFRAVLAELAGRVCGSSRPAEIFQGTQGHQTPRHSGGALNETALCAVAPTVVKF